MIEIKIDDKIGYWEYRMILKKMDSKKNRETFFYSDRNCNKDKTALKNGFFVTAREEGKMIGFMKIITDRAYLYYISELMILPEFQGQRLATVMMKKFMDYCRKKKAIKVFLTSLPKLEHYYKRLGFTNCEYPVLKMRR